MFSHLSYALPVWMNQQLHQRLERTQNRAVRLCKNLSKFDHVSDHYRSVQHGLTVHQIDVTTATAFLNGKLEEETYMQQPNGFVCQGKEKHVCKLKKSIYGLKQPPHCWNLILDAYLKKLKFVQTASNPCIYYRRAGGDIKPLGDAEILALPQDRMFHQSQFHISV